MGCAVVNAAAFKIGQPRHVRLLVASTSCDHNRLGTKYASIIRYKLVGLAMPSELRDSLRYCKFGAESSGLCDGTSGELLSGYTGWEAEIVFDFRTRTRLSSRGMPI